MITERQLNRLALRYLSDLRGIPQTLAEVAEHVQGRLRRPCEAEIERALNTLETLGYVARAEATAADLPCWKATAAGIRQAEKQVKPEELDPMIWGT